MILQNCTQILSCFKIAYFKIFTILVFGIQFFYNVDYCSIHFLNCPTCLGKILLLNIKLCGYK